MRKGCRVSLEYPAPAHQATRKERLDKAKLQSRATRRHLSRMALMRLIAESWIPGSPYSKPREHLNLWCGANVVDRAAEPISARKKLWRFSYEVRCIAFSGD